MTGHLHFRWFKDTIAITEPRQKQALENGPEYNASLALPFAAIYKQTELSEFKAQIISSLIDAAVKLAEPTNNYWDVSLSTSNFFLCVQLKWHEGSSGWPDIAKIGETQFDFGEPMERSAINVNITKSSVGQPESFVITHRGRLINELLSAALALMIEAGIAPQRGAPEVLDAFYGPGGYINRDKAAHLAAASAALQRSPELRGAFAPELTAALL